MKVAGKYNEAIIFTKEIEQSAINQIKTLCDQVFVAGSKIRIMPDVHSGAGCVIGFTQTITDKVVPSLVGVDIGCGMRTVKLAEKNIDFEKLDEIIRKHIPAGFSIRDNSIHFEALSELKCFDDLKNMDRIEKSLGTLGGGNHFIEVDRDEEGNLYLIVHSGSRNLGKQVADIYQEKAVQNLDYSVLVKKKVKKTIEEFGRKEGLEEEIVKARKSVAFIPEKLRYLEGHEAEDYLHDMKICQQWAEANREAIVNEIVLRMGLTIVDSFETVHNYINFEDNILRKGAVSAHEGEKLLIPLNMRDGCILGVGKGNQDWNFSAPHGAGRIMSRSEAKKKVSLSEFENSMKGVFSTSVGIDTLDESPMAYKPIEAILDVVGETIEIVNLLKPVYNFKAGEK